MQTSQNNFRLILLYSLFALILLTVFEVKAQTSYKIIQTTFDNADHKWPSVNNHGHIVWSQQVGSYLQVFKCEPVNERCDVSNTSQITFDDRNHERPVISDDGAILWFQDNSGGGIGYQVVRRETNNSVTIVEFSSRNSLNGQHRDAGKDFGISSVGQSISYYTFFGFTTTRRFNVSGIGELKDRWGSRGDFYGYGHPDVNATLDIVYSSDSGGVYKAEIDPIDGRVVNQTLIDAAGQFPRISDRNASGAFEVVYLRNAQVVSSIYGVVSPGSWADVNNHHKIVFAQVNQGVSQIFTAILGVYGVDLSQPPSSWQQIEDYYRQDGKELQFVIAAAWGGRNQYDAATILANAPQGWQKAAYCELNFNDSARTAVNPRDQTGFWQCQRAIDAVGAQKTHLKFMAVAAEVAGGLWTGTNPERNRAVPRICEAIRSVELAGLRPLIYTNFEHWRIITATYDGLIGYPLWWASHLQRPIPATLTFPDDVSVDPVTGFNYARNPNPGWPEDHLVGKQFLLDDAASGGGRVDVNIFSPDQFSQPQQPSLGLALDVTSEVTIVRGGIVYNRGTGRWEQEVAIAPRSAPIGGPITLILDDLADATGNLLSVGLFNANGYSDSAPPGTLYQSPYIHFGGIHNCSNVLSPPQFARVKLEFVNPSNLGITYNARVLAGFGAR